MVEWFEETRSRGGHHHRPGLLCGACWWAGRREWLAPRHSYRNARVFSWSCISTRIMYKTTHTGVYTSIIYCEVKRHKKQKYHRTQPSNTPSAIMAALPTYTAWLGNSTIWTITIIDSSHLLPTALSSTGVLDAPFFPHYMQTLLIATHRKKSHTFTLSYVIDTITSNSDGFYAFPYRFYTISWAV